MTTSHADDGTDVADSPSQKAIALWSSWIAEKHNLWSHVHVSGILLRTEAWWLSVRLSFILSDSADCSSLLEEGAQWPSGFHAFRVAAGKEVLASLLAGIEPGVIPAGTVPGISDQIVLNVSKQISPAGLPRLESPNLSPDPAAPHRRWPRFTFEFQSGSLADYFGEAYFEQLAKLDTRLAVDGHGTISEIAAKLGLVNRGEHISNFWRSSSSVQLTAPLEARLAQTSWDAAKSIQTCLVETGPRVARDRFRVLLSDPLATGRSKPQTLPIEGKSPFRVGLAAAMPSPDSRIRLTFESEIVHEISAAPAIRSATIQGDVTREGASPANTNTAVKRNQTPQTFETAFQTYKRVDVLGEGGGGRVFSVTDEGGRLHALKLIKADRSGREVMRRFRNEMAFCVRWHHKNIVRIDDWGFVGEGEERRPFYVMRHYPETLRSAMGRALSPAHVKTILTALLDGVEAAHNHEVWHRDLKPENVLLDMTSSDVVIADFGAAHFPFSTRRTTVFTKTGQRLANDVYAAPEQRSRGARHSVNGRADIFALGMILNEMFTGAPPLGTGFRRIEAARPDFGYLDVLVDRMMHQDPMSRPDTISAVRAIADLVHPRWDLAA